MSNLPTNTDKCWRWLILRIQAYQIIVVGWGKKVKNNDWLNKALKNSPVENQDGWEYGIVEVKQDNRNIYGYLGQEADEDLFTYDKSKQRNDIDKYKWVNTFFLIDRSGGKLFVHKKKYTPSNLNHGKTIARLEFILSKVFLKEFKCKVQLFPYRTGLNQTEFKHIFYNNSVIQTKFSDIYGTYVSTEAKLHNPKIEMDKVRAESHNKYDSKILKKMALEAQDGKSLSKSPSARTMVESGAVGEMIKYVSNQGEVVTEYKESKAILNYVAEVAEDLDELYSSVKHFIAGKKSFINKFKLFEDDKKLLDIDEDDRDE